MCKCDPKCKTPFCGKGNCHWPEKQPEDQKEIIEVRNDTDKPLVVSACRSKFSGRLYVELGGDHNPEKVEAHYYALVEVNQVDY